MQVDSDFFQNIVGVVDDLDCVQSLVVKFGAALDHEQRVGKLELDPFAEDIVLEDWNFLEVPLLKGQKLVRHQFVQGNLLDVLVIRIE